MGDWHITGECCTFWSWRDVTVFHGNRDWKEMCKVIMLVPIPAPQLFPMPVPNFWSSFLGDTFWMSYILPTLSPSQIPVSSHEFFFLSQVNILERDLGSWRLTASGKSDLLGMLSQALDLITPSHSSHGTCATLF